MKKNKGFTLIELLVVIAILAILASVGLVNFRSSQIKSRDAKRKSDLGQVQRALEIYFNDKGVYPLANLSWGSLLSDPENENTIYMKELPHDPIGSPEYCYQSNSGLDYQLYAKLENSQDAALGGPYICGGNATYNYGKASSNASP